LLALQRECFRLPLEVPTLIGANFLQQRNDAASALVTATFGMNRP